MSDYEDRDHERAQETSDDNDDDDDEEFFLQDTDAQKKKRLFEDAQAAIRQQEGNFQKDEDLAAFLRRFRDVIGQQFDDPISPTLLHSIVQLLKHNRIKSRGVHRLVKHIVKEHPEVLRYTTEKGENPLYLAVGFKKWALVDYMVTACSSAEYLADAIAGPCRTEDGKTSLHLALENDLRPQITEKLIRNARDDALGKKDRGGKTPLHYAVNFAQCGDERAQIIDMFIERDARLITQLKEKNPNQPISTFLDEVDKYQLSVYRQHLESAASYVPPKVVQAVSEDTKSQPVASRPEAGEQQSRGEPRDPERYKSQGQREREREPREPRGVRVRTRLVEREREAPWDERENERRILRERERGDRDWGQHDDRDRDRGRQARRREAEDSEPLHAWEGYTTAAHRMAADGPLYPIATSDQVRAEASPNTPVKRRPTIRLDGPEEAKSHDKPTSQLKKKDKPDPHTLERNSESICAKLKLHYMRTRSTEMATSFLYGRNIEGVQICFEYNGLPEEVKDEVFVKSFGADEEAGIRFDKVLQYVSFPKVHVIIKKATGKNAAKEVATTSRRDMQFFFDWLYKKGVRHIIKVNVDDTSIPAHSDQAIQNSLQKIVVEKLNWHKVDLDPRTICRVGTKLEKEKNSGKFEDVPSQLAEVTLRWSGNNAALRAWSESEGLSLLPKLSRVHLYLPPVTEAYDSQEWIDNNVNEFQGRLNKNAKAARASLQPSETTEKDPGEKGAESKPIEPKKKAVSKQGVEKNVVDVFQIRANTGRSQRILVGHRDVSEPASSSVQAKNSHQWLECMDLFARKFKPFWEITLAEFQESRGERAAETAEGVEKDVVIALIDDGVDSCDDSLAGQILDGKTFDYQGETMGQHFVSANGHGTVMADMINRICPMAKIYPIRLKMEQGKSGNMQIVAKSAALAIQAALDKGATIISMSWTLPIPEENSEEMALLTKVLDRAVKSKALMFCSSPDSGKFTSEDFPTAHNRNRFFRIGAAQDDGTAFRWSGPIDSLDFILPGVDVVRNYPHRRVPSRVQEIRSETGSSVATALASGLAAVIIYCVKACALAILTAKAKSGGDDQTAPDIMPPSEVNKIAEHASMKEALGKLGKLTGDRFIPVWESFAPVNEVFSEDFAPPKKKLESLISLSKKLIPMR